MQDQAVAARVVEDVEVVAADEVRRSDGGASGELDVCVAEEGLGEMPFGALRALLADVDDVVLWMGVSGNAPR